MTRSGLTPLTSQRGWAPRVPEGGPPSLPPRCSARVSGIIAVPWGLREGEAGSRPVLRVEPGPYGVGVAVLGGGGALKISF